MNYCLYCGLEALPSEIYNYVQLYECSKHHRTATIIDNEDISEDEKDIKVA